MCQAEFFERIIQLTRSRLLYLLLIITILLWFQLTATSYHKFNFSSFGYHLQSGWGQVGVKPHFVKIIKIPKQLCFGIYSGCGGWIWTNDLRVMSSAELIPSCIIKYHTVRNIAISRNTSTVLSRKNQVVFFLKLVHELVH